MGGEKYFSFFLVPDKPSLPTSRLIRILYYYNRKEKKVSAKVF
jgi:hypothetical protein